MMVLAACRRASSLVLAVVCKNVVIDVYRYRLHGRAGQLRIAALVAQAAADYEATVIVAEPGSVVSQALVTAAVPFMPATVAAVKHRLLAASGQHLHGHLYQLLVDEHPQLRRFVRIDPRTGRVPTADRWRTVPLLAAALGLGATMTLIQTNHQQDI